MFNKISTSIEGISEIDHNTTTFLLALLCLILVISTIDFMLGWVNASFNPEVVFVSGVAIYGIIKKMMYFIVLVIFLFVAFLIVPKELAIGSLSILYIGYLRSELNSVLSHLGISEDGKEGSLFIDFIKKIFNKEM